MRRYPLYIFDLDGTLYRGSQAIPGAAETLLQLRKTGSQVRFLTNNSSQTPQAQADKLSAMGIQADPSEVLTSGLGTAIYLAERGLNRAFVVGEPGLIAQLESKGVRSVTGGEECDAIVVGICRQFTYDWLNEAMQRIVAGAAFVATNTDATYPMEHGFVPGAGSVVAAVQTCSGRKPVVIGKPNTFLVEMALRLSGTRPENALVVGDRYETDIVSGLDAGCDTLLVLTGVARQAPAGQASAQSLLELLD
ncbi:MAG TPA: HAD-IIA family hydrolase [Fimbriimonadaceae bacterium]|nr:HAD-IIA family hydrolase [Fimbriimonadaceae bacterium]